MGKHLFSPTMEPNKGPCQDYWPVNGDVLGSCISGAITLLTTGVTLSGSVDDKSSSSMDLRSDIRAC